MQLGHDYVNVHEQSLAGRIPRECEHPHANNPIEARTRVVE